MKIREISPEEVPLWAEYCDREWEHGGIIAPVTLVDIEKPFPAGVEKTHLFVEVNGDTAAGLTIQMNTVTNKGSYGCKYWLDMWVVEQFRGQIEDEIIQKCDAIMEKKGIQRFSSRIPDYQSRFTQIFKNRGYNELYKEDTFIRETKAPIDDVMHSYYEQAKEKMHLRVSQNLKEDMKTYIDLVNAVSAEIPNMSPLYRDSLSSIMYDGKRHMIGVWIFAEVDTVPAGFIGALISFQKLLGKNRAVGKIINNGVLKQFRGMGMGTALYVKMIEELKKWNTEYILDYMVMEDNIPERTLLKELGFEAAQKHVSMEKVL